VALERPAQSNSARPPTEIYALAGKRIREVRLATRPKLTQDQLGQKIGLSRTSITNIEKGRQKIFLHILAGIASVLGVPLNQLLPPEPATKRMDSKFSHLSGPEQTFVTSVIRASAKGKTRR
jgi:transcriptional regulator with XRE-family HTH domain